MKPRRRWLRILVRSILALIAIILCLVALAFANTLWFSDHETPRSGTFADAAPPLPADEPFELRVMSWNIAKCFVYEGGVSFKSRADVEARLRDMAAVINVEKPDLVFLCEVVTECGPCNVDQVQTLAKETGMHAWAFGEKFNIGLPFYRTVTGNAILSRRPLRTLGNMTLAGGWWYYVAKNHYRTLWCEADIAGKPVLLGSIHNDTIDMANNAVEAKEILAYCKGRDTILAGDFNARPSEPAMIAVRESGQFRGEWDGPLTFPADKPDQKIDFILVPPAWELIEHRVLESQLSDHRAVVSVFRVTP